MASPATVVKGIDHVGRDRLRFADEVHIPFRDTFSDEELPAAVWPRSMQSAVDQ